MRSLLTILLIGLFYRIADAQPVFGIELSSSILKTFNNGRLEGASFGFGGYTIDGERDIVTSTYAIGLLCLVKEKHLFKFSIGWHQNGRELDINTWDDIVGPDDIYTNVSMPYKYLQIRPSYAYRFLIGKFMIPTEIGCSMNKLIREEDIFFVGVKKFNFDLNLSTGIHYLILDNFTAGVNVVYNYGLSNYQNKWEYGTFQPRQFGLEFSLTCMIIK